MTYRDYHFILLKTGQAYNDIQISIQKRKDQNFFSPDFNIKLLNKICTVLPIKDDFWLNSGSLCDHYESGLKLLKTFFNYPKNIL